MNTKQRMSPLTALFLGVMITGSVTIASVTAIVLYGMRIADSKATAVLTWLEDPVEGLPKLLESVPELADKLQYGLVPEYADQIEVKIGFVTSDDARRPSIAVTNKGSEAISYLAVRAAALRSDGVALKDWTLVAATPIGAEDCPGPLLPGQTTHVVASHWEGLRTPEGLEIKAVADVADIRIWDLDRLAELTPPHSSGATAGGR